jgi:hypothetical protein
VEDFLSSELGACQCLLAGLLLLPVSWGIGVILAAQQNDGEIQWEREKSAKHSY